tara:strand:+ start:209 stop:541 length:333 start_codon:yes stop_codon:yes gene_type:complete
MVLVVHHVVAAVHIQGNIGKERSGVLDAVYQVRQVVLVIKVVVGVMVNTVKLMDVVVLQIVQMGIPKAGVKVLVRGVAPTTTLILNQVTVAGGVMVKEMNAKRLVIEYKL